MSFIADTRYSGVGVFLSFNDALYEKVRLSVRFLDYTDPLIQYAKIDMGSAQGGTIYGDPRQSTIITIPVGRPGAGQQAYLVTQSFNVLSSWNDFNNIVIEAYISFNSHVVTGPIAPNGIDVTRKLLLSFIPSISDLKDIRNLVQYDPMNTYRLLPLVSDNALSSLNFKVSWQDHQQNLFPILLDPHDSAFLSLMFRKKSLGI